jgi:hypothetical protein
MNWPPGEVLISWRHQLSLLRKSHGLNGLDRRVNNTDDASNCQHLWLFHLIDPFLSFLSLRSNKYGKPRRYFTTQKSESLNLRFWWPPKVKREIQRAITYQTHQSSHSRTKLPSPWSHSRRCVIGHSMLERFKSTGCDTKVAHLPTCSNAAIGGDKTESVLYRMQTGLLEALELRKPKLWVVCIGTSNLRPKGVVRDTEVERFRLLLHALLRTSPGGYNSRQTDIV